jgi:histidinol dehydrogenase
MKNLQNITITHTDKNFYAKLSSLRKNINGTAAFDPISAEGKKVAGIINDVKKQGDKTVSKYTLAFDKVKLTPAQFKITPQELKSAHKNIDKKLLASIRKAIANVRKYQREIFVGKNKSFGSTGIKYTPIERVGLCIPGASAPLPSTVIMTAVPAQSAGVKEIVVVSPPRYNGSIHPTILATCYELGITEVYRIGGIQAAAALALGTKTIKPVDMIAGPGNSWVSTAKKMLFGYVKIDSIAGPSEVLIIADKTANPAYIAADMLSQAEHAPSGGAVLFTDSKSLAANVIKELNKQLELLPRKTQTLEILKKFSLVAVFKSIADCVNWANKLATEHLEIQCGKNSKKIADKIKNAGAIFIGDCSPVATGDYFAGPSHTLPTGGCARFASALTSNDFIKSSSIIEYNRETLKKSKDDIIRLAGAEGLDAHSNSVKIRFKTDKG